MVLDGPVLIIVIWKRCLVLRRMPGRNRRPCQRSLASRQDARDGYDFASVCPAPGDGHRGERQDCRLAAAVPGELEAHQCRHPALSHPLRRQSRADAAGRGTPTASPSWRRSPTRSTGLRRTCTRCFPATAGACASWVRWRCRSTRSSTSTSMSCCFATCALCSATSRKAGPTSSSRARRSNMSTIAGRTIIRSCAMRFSSTTASSSRRTMSSISTCSSARSSRMQNSSTPSASEECCLRSLS